jgi:hypothetical protein
LARRDSADTTDSIELAHFPPYGLVNAENVAFLSRRPVPLNFRADPKSPLPSSAVEWEKWIDALAREMADFLWPVYDNGKWNGKSTSTAVGLTRADLELIRLLQPTMYKRIHGKQRETGRHFDAFLKEDPPGAPGPASFVFYESDFPAYLQQELTDAITIGGREIARAPSQALKRVFQRPRPMQIAMMFGMSDIQLQVSIIAITPAMISGHCVQGSLALAHVELAMGDFFDQAPPGVRDDVHRFLVDTGDRRVLAGLHYPSDNIGSWYVSLRMCAHLFGPRADGIRAKLWAAIQKHSMVYKAVVNAAKAAKKTRGSSGAPIPESPYAALLAKLNEAANPLVR